MSRRWVSRSSEAALGPLALTQISLIKHNLQRIVLGKGSGMQRLVKTEKKIWGSLRSSNHIGTVFALGGKRSTWDPQFSGPGTV